MSIELRNLFEPTDDIHCKQPDTNAYVRSRDLGRGTLYVSESALYWISESGQGFTLDYHWISLHAISRDVSCFWSECIYLMVEATFEGLADDEYRYECKKLTKRLASCKLPREDKNAKASGNEDRLDTRFADNEAVVSHGDSSENEDEDDGQCITEIRFVPHNKASLDTIFQALSACQALHPDEADSFSEGEDEFSHTEDTRLGVGFSDEVAFDEYGQVICEQRPQMRGVTMDEGEDSPRNGLPKNESDDEAMEMGQFDDA